MNYKRFILYSGIIGISFLWGGSAYISQMYRLYGLFTPQQVDVIAMRWNYLAQIIGILTFAFAFYQIPRMASKRVVYISTALIGAVAILFMLNSDNGSIVVATGILLNLVIGYLGGHQFALLAAYVPQQERGRVFGFAYAFGSIGTYLLNLYSNGALLSSTRVVTFYLLFIAVNIVFAALSKDLPLLKPASKPSLPSFKNAFLYFSVFFIMSFLNSVGSHYKSALMFDGEVNLETARAFYAVGLVIAGIITDRSRKYGAISCLASLVFPFMAIVLYNHPSLVFATWAASYVVLGFYSVYRVVAFADLADKRSMLYVAGLGLAIGRMGEAASTFVGDSVLQNPVYIELLVVVLFVVLLFLFIQLFQKAYVSTIILTNDHKSLYKAFEGKYDFTNREREVFRHLLSGHSNGEIANLIYVSDSTVKFHVKNILKKTECANRMELRKLLDGQSIR